MQTAEAFSGVLRSNSTLREVDLSSNALGVAGGRMLREAMADNMYVYTLVVLLAASLHTSDASLILLHWFIISPNILHLVCSAVASLNTLSQTMLCQQARMHQDSRVASTNSKTSFIWSAVPLRC